MLTVKADISLLAALLDGCGGRRGTLFDRLTASLSLHIGRWDKVLHVVCPLGEQITLIKIKMGLLLFPTWQRGVKYAMQDFAKEYLSGISSRVAISAWLHSGN